MYALPAAKTINPAISEPFPVQSGAVCRLNSVSFTPEWYGYCVLFFDKFPYFTLYLRNIVALHALVRRTLLCVSSPHSCAFICHRQRHTHSPSVSLRRNGALPQNLKISRQTDNFFRIGKECAKHYTMPTAGPDILHFAFCILH